MAMKVKEVADLVGLSVRTLHHYDHIGLLTPEKTTESGYRLYSDEDLEKLQQILFFKELDFPLKRIKELIHRPSFDKLEALELQRKMLLEKQRRMNRMLATIDKSIRHMKGEVEMTNKEKFEGFDFSHNPYEQEARERWGDDAVNRSNAKIANMSKSEQEALAKKCDTIYKQLASLLNDSPQSKEAQEAIKEWFQLLNKNFGHYTLEAFKGLGQMYIADDRFRQNIDKYGDGLAKFMSEAMAIYSEQNKE